MTFKVTAMVPCILSRENKLREPIGLCIYKPLPSIFNRKRDSPANSNLCEVFSGGELHLDFVGEDDDLFVVGKMQELFVIFFFFFFFFSFNR